MDILHGSDIFTSNANLLRKEVFDLAKSIKLYGDKISPLTSWDLKYIIDDNNEWIQAGPGIHDSLVMEYVDSTNLFYSGTRVSNDQNKIIKSTRNPFLKYFHKSPANFYEVDAEGFKMRVNPVLNLHAGKEADESNIIFQNTRGINIRAYIDDKVYLFKRQSECGTRRDP